MRGERERREQDSGDDSVRAGEGADDGSATRGRVEKGATREQDIASDDLTYVKRRGVHAKKGENRTACRIGGKDRDAVHRSRRLA